MRPSNALVASGTGPDETVLAGRDMLTSTRAKSGTSTASVGLDMWQAGYGRAVVRTLRYLVQTIDDPQAPRAVLRRGSWAFQLAAIYGTARVERGVAHLSGLDSRARHLISPRGFEHVLRGGEPLARYTRELHGRASMRVSR